MWDLRAEVAGLSEPARTRFVDAIASDWRTADMPAADHALCAFAEKLTRHPGSMCEADVAALRAHGLDDRAIADATQIVAYFNYINRVADALHVDLEPEMPPRAPGN